MSSRAETLRKRDRRVLGWSLGVAAAIHIVVFMAAPGFRVEGLSTPDLELDTAGVAGGGNALVEVFFGPTLVKVADGADWTAPSTRTLSAERPVRLQERCLTLTDARRLPASGRVALRIKPSGRVDVMGLVAGTGEACADRLLVDIAGDLWYHWLPNDRFRPPLNVEQPVTLVAAFLAGF